ncbi:MAG: DEAD/DEAH box helicase [Candidatus Xenobia bacterium]
MLPSLLAHQIRETLLDYLHTTFALRDEKVEKALFAFLRHPEHGIFKGPYIDVRLPFRKADGKTPLPLDIRPPFTPYAHQLIAFDRLTARDGHQPQHTIVTTGTGSGKTECFLYPILDHCYRNADRPGIKAILLYPMNALATDQARRLAKLLYHHPLLRGGLPSSARVKAISRTACPTSTSNGCIGIGRYATWKRETLRAETCSNSCARSVSVRDLSPSVDVDAVS